MYSFPEVTTSTVKMNADLITIYWKVQAKGGFWASRYLQTSPLLNMDGLGGKKVALTLVVAIFIVLFGVFVEYDTSANPHMSKNSTDRSGYNGLEQYYASEWIFIAQNRIKVMKPWFTLGL